MSNNNQPSNAVIRSTNALIERMDTANRAAKAIASLPSKERVAVYLNAEDTKKDASANAVINDLKAMFR